jgi:hypothetical protein
MNDETYTVMLELNLGDRDPGWTISAVRRDGSGDGDEIHPRLRVVPDIALAMVKGMGPYEQFVRLANNAVRQKLAEYREQLQRSIAELEATEHALARWDRVTGTNYPEASDQGAGEDSGRVASQAHCTAHLDYVPECPWCNQGARAMSETGEPRRCGVVNPDYPTEPGCSLSPGHDRVSIHDHEEPEFVATDELYDHARPEAGAFWNMPGPEDRIPARSEVEGLEGLEDLKGVAVHLRGGWLGENATPEQIEEVLREHVRGANWQMDVMLRHLVNEHGYDPEAVSSSWSTRVIAHARDHRPYIEKLVRERKAREKIENDKQKGRQGDGTDE